MPFRQRERFERTDVPRYSPHRNAIAIGVLVAASILEAFISAVLLIQFRKMPRPVPCHGGEG